jgi:hypothetical protein
MGVLRAEATLLAYQRYHVAQRSLGGIIEILVESHGDPVGCRLGTRRGETKIAANMEFEGPRERGLDRDQADFSVSLKCVTVARGEQGARHEYWKIDGAADAKLLVVHVAAESPRLLRREPAP